MNKIERGEQLYQDLVHLNSYYAKINNDMIPAMYRHFDPTGLEIALFMDIATSYEGTRQPCAYSYTDLANKYFKTSCGIKKAIQQLIKHDLIKVVGERQGRAKTLYIPNIDTVAKWLMDYIKDRSV